MRIVSAPCVLDCLASDGILARAERDFILDPGLWESRGRVFWHSCAAVCRGTQARKSIRVERRGDGFAMREDETFKRQWYVLCGMPRDRFDDCVVHA